MWVFHHLSQLLTFKNLHNFAHLPNKLEINVPKSHASGDQIYRYLCHVLVFDWCHIFIFLISLDCIHRNDNFRTKKIEFSVTAIVI
jgi:hypothetical protein